MTWKNKKLETVKITSKLGGNCRLRVYNELQTTPSNRLTVAKGENKHPLFEVSEIKGSLISAKVKLDTLELKRTYLYDIASEAGKTYLISGGNKHSTTHISAWRRNGRGMAGF